MYHYGLLLTDFEQNGEFVNDCIFTMMHHIGGEIEQITSLFQPVILKTFSKIYETEYMLCDVSFVDSACDVCFLGFFKLTFCRIPWGTVELSSEIVET